MSGMLTKLYRVSLSRFLMRIFWVFPLFKKRVFFSSYEGRQYSCNPKAIFEEMRKDPCFNDYTYIWEINDSAVREMVGHSGVIMVKHNSLRYMFAVMTSKYLVTNTGITCRFPIRRGQVNINTWHGGGAFKKVGYAVANDIGAYLNEVEIASRQTTHYLTSSRAFTEIMSDSVKMPKDRFCPTGMPRNDMLCDSFRLDSAKRRVMTHFDIPKDSVVILYAPTYRGAIGTDLSEGIPFDVGALRRSVKEKFASDSVLMVRMHYFNCAEIDYPGVVSASGYPDMQELLAAADILITDYSSCMWDFALTKRLCLIYAYDLHEYDQERGFYTKPETWPGLLCENNEELIGSIETFCQATYEKKIDDYLLDYESYEMGTGAKQVVDIIKSN